MRPWKSTLAAALLVLTSCGEERELCDGVQCGQHGSCVDGSCQCDPGWQPTPEGLSCIAFPHDVCEGISCSGLGSCVPMEGGPGGELRPVCQCDPGTVSTADELGCIDPCAGIDCGPGSCTLDDQDRPACDCPPGFDILEDPPGCRERTLFIYELILYPDEDPFVFGTAWMRRKHTEQGVTVESTVTFRLPVSYETEVGSDIVTVGRYDGEGRLVEVAQDRLKEYGTVSLRRRLHYTVEERDPGEAMLRFESNILDRIWHGEMELAGPTPAPMAGEYDYPGFAFGCFDPFFYQALAGQVDFSAERTEFLAVMIPGFVLPTALEAVVSGSEQNGVIRIEDFDILATFEEGVLQEVQIGDDFVALRKTEEGSALEINLPPLPRAPVEHEVSPLPGTHDSEINFESTDGTQLAGTLTLPTGNPKPVAVLMVSGVLKANRDKAAYHDQTYRDLAAHLAADGFASFRFDGRGNGDSSGAATAELARLEEDLDAAYGVLADTPGIGGIVLLAHGFATPYLLPAGRRLSPAGMIVLAPTGGDFATDFSHWMLTVLGVAGYMQETIEKNRDYYEQTFQALRDGSITDDFYGRSAAFWKELLGRDPLDASGIAAPVLLLRGGEDFILPEGNIEELAAALGGAGCVVESRSMPGLSHRFTPGAFSDLWELIHLPFGFDADAAAVIVSWLGNL